MVSTVVGVGGAGLVGGEGGSVGGLVGGAVGGCVVVVVEMVVVVVVVVAADVVAISCMVEEVVVPSGKGGLEAGGGVGVGPQPVKKSVRVMANDRSMTDGIPAVRHLPLCLNPGFLKKSAPFPWSLLAAAH